MTHGSLFSGIGGFDLAAEWMGWENKFHCEWNEFGQKVLHHYWPNAEQFTDIKKSNFTKYANRIDILTGGFPCQPYSNAGKRLGKEDDRHLWPEMLRAIREIQPRWVVGENVRGLTNWNGGVVFNEVQADLEAEGYEITPFLLPACAVNAPHRRDRIWFVAFKDTISNGFIQRKSEQEGAEVRKFGYISTRGINRICLQTGDAADTNTPRLKTFYNKEYNLGQENRTKAFSGNSIKSIYSRNWRESFPSVSPICNGNDGISDRLDSITFPKWRNESIKAGGNAIVPQVVYQIFKAIQKYERISATNKNS